MKESDIEKYVKRELKKHGWFLTKWVAPGESGVPDRLVIMDSRIIPVEFKKPGGALSERQKLWQERFKALNVETHIVGSMEEAKEFVIYTTSLSKQND